MGSPSLSLFSLVLEENLLFIIYEKTDEKYIKAFYLVMSSSLHLFCRSFILTEKPFKMCFCLFGCFFSGQVAFKSLIKPIDRTLLLFFRFCH